MGAGKPTTRGRSLRRCHITKRTSISCENSKRHTSRSLSQWPSAFVFCFAKWEILSCHCKISWQWNIRQQENTKSISSWMNELLMLMTLTRADTQRERVRMTLVRGSRLGNGLTWGMKPNEIFMMKPSTTWHRKKRPGQFECVIDPKGSNIPTDHTTTTRTTLCPSWLLVYWVSNEKPITRIHTGLTSQLEEWADDTTIPSCSSVGYNPISDSSRLTMMTAESSASFFFLSMFQLLLESSHFGCLLSLCVHWQVLVIHKHHEH